MDETRKTRSSSSRLDERATTKRLLSLSSADLKDLHSTLEDVVRLYRLTHATINEISEDHIYYILQQVAFVLRDTESCKELLDGRWAVLSYRRTMKETLTEVVVKELAQLICECRDKGNWDAFILHPILWKKVSQSSGSVHNDDPDTTAQERATVESWSRTFEGNTPVALWKHIARHSQSADTYAKFAAIVQSSGTGKSRLVDELSKTRFVIPLNLREDGSSGFPPPDADVRDWLRACVTPEDAYAQNLSFLEALFKHTCDILTSEFQKELKAGSRQVAAAFRVRMSANMKMRVHSQFRVEFFQEVLRLAKLGVPAIVDFLEKYRKDENKVHMTPTKSKTTVYAAERRCNELCELLRDAGGKKRQANEEIQVVVAWDEAHTLARPPGIVLRGWSVLNELRYALRALHNSSFFTLFLSTTGKISHFAPAAHRDESSRIALRELVLIPPYVDLGFDQLAIKKRASNPSTLDEVTSDHYMAHLGRPLFGSRLDTSDAKRIRDWLIDFAAHKLLNESPKAKTLSDEQKLACLSQRLVIEFNSTTYTAHEQERQQVQGHLRACLKVDDGLETMITVTPSEPLLAEAAYAVMQRPDFSAPDALRQVLEGFSIHKGDRGELLVLLLLTLSRDAAVGPPDKQHRPGNGRAVEVPQFISQLFSRGNSGPHTIDDILVSGPSIHPEGSDKPTFLDTFSNCWFHFNHFIKVHQHGNVNRKYLTALMHRGAAILCGNNQKGIDGINPFVYKSKVLKRLEIGVLLWQTKNDSKYTDKPKLSLFDTMDPYDLGIFDEGDAPIPIIRIIFALASKVPCLKIVQHNKNARYTSYDIWCAGISPEVLLPILEKDATVWTALLQASYGWENTYAGENSSLKMALNPGAAMGAPFWSLWYEHDA